MEYNDGNIVIDDAMGTTSSWIYLGLNINVVNGCNSVLYGISCCSESTWTAYVINHN